MQIKPVNRAYVGRKYHSLPDFGIGLVSFRFNQILLLGYFR